MIENKLNARLQHAVIDNGTTVNSRPKEGEIIFNNTLDNFRVGKLNNNQNVAYSSLPNIVPYGFYNGTDVSAVTDSIPSIPDYKIKVGDYYLNTSTCHLWQCRSVTETNKWNDLGVLDSDFLQDTSNNNNPLLTKANNKQAYFSNKAFLNNGSATLFLEDTYKIELSAGNGSLKLSEWSNNDWNLVRGLLISGGTVANVASGQLLESKGLTVNPGWTTFNTTGFLKRIGTTTQSTTSYSWTLEDIVDFTGATASTLDGRDGSAGLVPTPHYNTNDNNAYLRGDGTWHKPTTVGFGWGTLSNWESTNPNFVPNANPYYYNPATSTYKFIGTTAGEGITASTKQCYVTQGQIESIVTKIDLNKAGTGTLGGIKVSDTTSQITSNSTGLCYPVVTDANGLAGTQIPTASEGVKGLLIVTKDVPTEDTITPIYGYQNIIAIDAVPVFNGEVLMKEFHVSDDPDPAKIYDGAYYDGDGDHPGPADYTPCHFVNIHDIINGLIRNEQLLQLLRDALDNPKQYAQ